MAEYATERLQREYAELQENPRPGISCVPFDDKFLQWNAIILGPLGSPFESGIFELTLEFPETYPFKPPVAKFISNMFHPNINANDGTVWADIFQSAWCASLTLPTILLSIQSLLNDPNPNDPANRVAAQLYLEDRSQYEQHVQETIEQSWMKMNNAEKLRHLTAQGDDPVDYDEYDEAAFNRVNEDLNDSPRESNSSSTLHGDTTATNEEHSINETAGTAERTGEIVIPFAKNTS